MWCARARQRWRRSAVSRFLPEGWHTPARHQVVGLSAGAAVWLEATPDGRLAWQQATWSATPSGSEAAAAMASVTARLNGSARRRLSWILAPGLAPSWLQHPSTQVTSLEELHAVARARASQLFGLPASPIAAEVTWHVMADWHARRPFVCVAVPAGWQQLLQADDNSVAGKYRSAVAQPLLLALSRFRKQLPKDGWLALVLAGEVHLMHRQRGQSTRLRNLRLPPDASPARIQALALEEWQREMLRSELPGDQLSWLDLMSPPHASPDAAPLRRIAWIAHARLPAPLVPTFSNETSAPETAFHDAMQTAWTAEQLLSGDWR